MVIRICDAIEQNIIYYAYIIVYYVVVVTKNHKHTEIAAYHKNMKFGLIHCSSNGHKCLYNNK